MAILTAKVGTNATQFPEILELYVPPGSSVLDMTYGKGTFWKKAPKFWDVTTNDIDPNRGEFSYDFRELPMEWTNSFEAVVFDPPYMAGHVGKNGPSGGSEIKDALQNRYKVYDSEINLVEDVFELYKGGIEEAHRILEKKGMLILKCQDQVESGRNKWLHIWLHNYCVQGRWWPVDLFVMVRNNKPPMRHKHQIHARKNHSFWWVFRKD